MSNVETDNIIFMYANGVGIVGIGRARGAREILDLGAVDRLFSGTDTPEWRVAVDWLGWVADRDACPWASITPKTFLNVSGEIYSDRRKAVIQHFHRMGIIDVWPD